MPNKNHRTVKMSDATQHPAVNIWRVLSAVLLTTAVAVLALISGGISSGAVGLFVIGPLVFWLIWGAASVRIALFSGFIGLTILALIQVFGAVPEPVARVSLISGWVSAVILLVSGLGLAVYLTRGSGRSARGAESEAPPAVPFTLPDDGPVLMIDVSPLGRIRRVAGAGDLLPAARAGRQASAVLKDRDGKDLSAGVAQLASGHKVTIWLEQRESGPLYLIARSEGEAASDAEDLARQLRERTDFFAGLGHDLKSPLNAVIGFSEMMESEIRGPIPEAYKSYPALIRESGQTLLRLVEDMLGFARSEAGTYELDPSPMDITASGETVMRQSQAEAERAEVKLVMKTQGEVLAMADAGAVQRIWDNLVSNAIKYSPTGSVVTLAAQGGDRTVRLSVTDKGAGMDADDLERIARPFEQGRNARGRAGTGLGLAMVKRLAELHGGKLVIRTAPGEGTQVVVSLPAVTSTSSKAAE